MTGGRRRRRVAAAGAGAALLSLAGVGAGAAHASQLSGYEISTAADAVAWVPILPGFVPGADSPGEISLSDTAASLASGGVAYGRGALNYPGSFGAHLGPLMQEEGTPASVAQAIPPWPTLAEAGGGSGLVSNNQVPGATIQAYGSPRRASGDSVLPGISFPGMLQIGSITTHSLSSIEDGTPRASSSTVLHDISIAGGAVTISAMTSSSSVTGSTAAGSVQVAGMRVGGIPATVDASGVHALGASVPGSDLNRAVLQSLKAARLEVSVAEPITGRTATGVSRQAGGLVVGIDTPESPAASPGVVVTELGATAASVSTSSGPGQAVASGAPLGATSGPPGGGATGGTASGTGPLPAVETGGLDTGPLTGGSSTGSAGPVAASGPGGVVGALNTVGAAVSYTFAGIPVGVVVISLLALLGGSFGLATWVRRLAAWRGEGPT